MTNTKKRAKWPLLLVLALVAGLSAALACGGEDGSGGTLTKVTLILDYTPNTNHSGIYLAKEKGWYRDEGIEIEIIEASAAGVEQTVGTEKADFGISYQEYLIPARAEGVPIVSVAAIIQHNTSSFLSLTAENIKRPKDMEGKTYGSFGGVLEEALVKKIVSCDGGDPAKVKFAPYGDVADYLVALQSNAFDFAWIFDAWDGVRADSVAKVANNRIAFSDHFDCIPDWYTPILITNEKTLKNDRPLAKRFMAATAKGYEYAIDQPAEAAEALLKNAPETDPALARASAEWLASRYVDRGRQWGLQDREIWVRFETFLREAGLYDKRVDVGPAYTNDLLPGK